MSDQKKPVLPPDVSKKLGVDIRRALESTPSFNIVKALESSPLFQANKHLEEFRRLEATITSLQSKMPESFKSIELVQKALENGPLFQANKYLEEFTRLEATIAGLQSKIPESFKTIELVQKALKLQGISTQLLESQNQIDSIARSLEVAIAPKAGAISALSKSLADIVGNNSPLFSSKLDWQESLAARMSSLRIDWAFADRFDQSILGFTRMARLSDAVHVDAPFAEGTGELVALELGAAIEVEADDPAAREKAAIDGGFNPELIAFPTAAYSNVVVAAGFEFKFTSAPIPKPLHQNTGDVWYDPTHNTILFELEQHLRQFVENGLRALAGEKWIKQRVSQTVRERWQNRQSEERDARRPVYPLVQYSDFMDLADVIGQANNWRDTFALVIGNREDFILSLRRLHPIRNAIAHHRPIGRSDILTLVCEATRIFSALKIPHMLG
ncbi:Swt1 family HEPN domain-containing protein [Taklimakanibacter deserti]|uniref:Swt1 family HEPN domain-containing protein n=1 Tax=Taklimakanibacter deserti TaxID=2267839 RepID=UPI0013C4F925